MLRLILARRILLKLIRDPLIFSNNSQIHPRSNNNKTNTRDKWPKRRIFILVIPPICTTCVEEVRFTKYPFLENFESEPENYVLIPGFTANYNLPPTMYSAPQGAVPMTNPIMMGGPGFPAHDPMASGWGQMPPRQSDEGSDEEGQARGAKRMRFAKKDLQIQIPDSKKVRLL